MRVRDGGYASPLVEQEWQLHGVTLRWDRRATLRRDDRDRSLLGNEENARGRVGRDRDRHLTVGSEAAWMPRLGGAEREREENPMRVVL